MELKQLPPSQAFLVALRGTFLYLSMIRLQAEGHIPMGIWPPSRAGF